MARRRTKAQTKASKAKQAAAKKTVTKGGGVRGNIAVIKRIRRPPTKWRKPCNELAYFKKFDLELNEARSGPTMKICAPDSRPGKMGRFAKGDRAGVRAEQRQQILGVSPKAKGKGKAAAAPARKSGRKRKPTQKLGFS